MKFILFITLLFSAISVFPQDKMYEEAFQYIENNKDEIKEIYNVYKPDSLIIHVSNELITYSPYNFVDQIMKYEFYYEADSTKSKILDILETYPEPNFSGRLKVEFSKFNKCKNYNLVLFFSRRSKNKLIADMVF